MAVGDLTDEYKDLSANMRHYDYMRFAQFALYLGLTAGLATVLFAVNPQPGEILRLALKLAGAVVAAAFGIMEERAVQYRRCFFTRALEIEALIGFKQYTKRPVRKIFRATNAERLLIWGSIPLWIITIVFGM